MRLRSITWKIHEVNQTKGPIYGMDQSMIAYRAIRAMGGRIVDWHHPGNLTTLTWVIAYV